MVLVVVSLVVLAHLGWWLWADWRARRLPGRLWLRAGLVVYMGALSAFIVWMFLYPDAGRAAHFWIPKWILAWIYIWFLGGAPLGLLIAGVAGLIGRVSRQSAVGSGQDGRTPPTAERLLPTVEGGLTRREVLGAAVLGAPLVITGGFVVQGMRMVRDFRVRRIDLALPNLPPALEGLGIAHITDVHVGRYTRGRTLREIAQTTNHLREVDLVLLTGDLIDLSLRDLPAALEMLERIDRRAGLHMCEGNHDLIDDGPAFRREVLAAGVPLLLNEARTVEVRGYPLQLIGANWGYGDAGRSAHVARALAHRELDRFSILLGHHPHVFDDAATAGIGLTLAGHTHGGQITVRGHASAGRALFRYLSGHYRKGDSSLVVSNGVGNWLPVRINAPAEIVHLVLHRAQGRGVL